jgi:hypothetical protein
MDSSDEKLTLENVDEQIEQCLSQSWEPQLQTRTSLARTVHNLQSIYEEERRLEHVWTRINRRASALKSDNAITQADGLQLVQGEKTAPQDAPVERFSSVLRGSDKQPRLLFRRSWYKPAIGLVAAIILIAFFIGPIVSYALRSLQTTSPKPPAKTVTPQTQPTVNASKQADPKTGSTVTPTIVSTTAPAATPSSTAVLSPTTNVSGIKVYSSQYFTIQYPADWVITSETTGGTYQQTVQFRPSATSSVFVNVNVMFRNALSSDLLLLADPDVKQGTLLSTSSVTYHGISWTVGTVAIAGSLQAPASKLEIAYTNQGTTPYRIELGATSDTFNSYTQIFNTMLASFYPAS